MKSLFCLASEQIKIFFHMTSSLFQHPGNAPLTHSFWIILPVFFYHRRLTLHLAEEYIHAYCFSAWRVTDFAPYLAHFQLSALPLVNAKTWCWTEFPESEQGEYLRQPSPCWLIYSTAITHLDRDGKKPKTVPEGKMSIRTKQVYPCSTMGRQYPTQGAETFLCTYTTRAATFSCRILVFSSHNLQLESKVQQKMQVFLPMHVMSVDQGLQGRSRSTA